ncbi:MAG: leucine-rich repeat protein [bacterium]|nr:leucine-rich repeat protein [bacterium]
MLYDTLVGKPRQERVAAENRAFTERQNAENRAAAARQAAEQRRFTAKMAYEQQRFAAQQSALQAERATAESEKQRKFAEEQSCRRQEFEREQQIKRQEFERQQLQERQDFDLLLNKRNADLQREMAWKNHDYRLEEQEQSFERQMGLAEYKAFLDRWPMVLPVNMLRREHMQGNLVTLGVFLFKNRDRIDSEIDKFWDVNIYPLVESDLNEWVENIYRNSFGINNIKFYRDSFRDDNAHHGSLVDVVRYALCGLPTVILESNLLPNELRISFTIWGLGDDSTKRYHQYTFRKQSCRVKTEKGWMNETECRRLADWICACFKMIIGCNFDAFNLAHYNHMPVFPEIAKYELEQRISSTPLLYDDLKKEFTGFYEGIYDLLLGPESAFAKDCVNNKLANAYAMRLCYAETLKDFVSKECLNKWLADSVEAWCALRGEKPAEDWLKGLLAGQYSRYQYFDADDEAYFREIVELMSEESRLKSVCCDTVRLLNAAESADDLFKEGRRLCKAEGEAEKKLGLNLYRRAAEMGLAAAQMALGNRLFNGDGVKEDKAEAVSWYRKAAEQGNAFAQYKLGLCYSNGDGVEPNKDEATKWLAMAADQGYEEAERKLAELKQGKQSAPAVQKNVKPEQPKVGPNAFVADKADLENAYFGCYETEVIIPDSVTSIGASAFSYCRGLSSVIIPDSVTSIGDDAFSGCSSLSSVVIPDSVISIGDYAFSGCSSLSSVVIPDSVTSIGDYAFNECSSLSSVVIPDSVTSIGDDAFRGCSSLSSVVIPDSVTSIGSAAFCGCSSLSSVVIPDSVTSIGDDAFSGCSSLSSVVIPDSVTSIGSDAFCGCSSLSSVVIPDSVTSIGDYAFIDCSSLSSVVIPDSVTSIGHSSFGGCSSLSSVVIPDSVTSIGDYAFYSCSSLSSVVIPDSVTSIGSAAFHGCSNLNSVVIRNSDASVGGVAFGDCIRLKSIFFRNKTFTNCAEFNQYINSRANNYVCAWSNDTLSRVVIPLHVTSIGDDAFSGCSSLSSVVIPDSVTSIGDHAFCDCRGLSSVVIPDSVTSIGDHAFSGCSSLSSVVIPDSVTSIGDGSFHGCSSLSSVVIPDSVTSIGASAFSYCRGLSSVIIPDSVTSIGASAFTACDNLSSIVIPDSVASIGKGIFENIFREYCKNLKAITFRGRVYSNVKDFENAALSCGVLKK